MVFILVPSHALAQHPYMGGQFRGNVLTTGRVLMCASFSETDPSELPSGYWLGAVPSDSLAAIRTLRPPDGLIKTYSL